MIYAIIAITAIAGLIITILAYIILDLREELEIEELKYNLLELESNENDNLREMYSKLQSKHLANRQSRLYLKKRVNNLEAELSVFRKTALRGRKMK